MAHYQDQFYRDGKITARFRLEFGIQTQTVYVNAKSTDEAFNFLVEKYPTAKVIYDSPVIGEQADYTI